SHTNFPSALDSYSACQRIDPKYAELHFRVGQALLRSGKTNEAKAAFESARDLDTLRFRADNHINASIRTLSSKEGVDLVDAVKLFAQNSPEGIAGQELLLEHVHLNFEGNYLLARAF